MPPGDSVNAATRRKNWRTEANTVAIPLVCRRIGDLMETRQPRAWSGLGSALPVAPDLPDTPVPPWTVFLWDSRPARLQRVSQIIAACGARLRCNDELSAIPQIESFHACALAVVALEA